MMHTSNAVDRAFPTIRTLVAITSVINYGTENYAVLYARLNTLRAINIDLILFFLCIYSTLAFFLLSE